METLILLLLLGTVAGLVIVGALVLWVWSQTSSRMSALDEKLTQNATVQTGTTQSFGEIQKTLGELSKASQNMEALGKEISGLSDLLRAPKLRGGIGELFLADLLSQMLTPEQYKLQYGFSSGERVDAVIVLKTGMVPVDAKFPLESFQRLAAEEDDAQRAKAKKEFVRTVKKHIDSIADKYIRPEEHTFDFALMYIPAENVYYETILKDEDLGDEKGIMAHALQRRVIPVSPNSFYAYLQAIALGLKGLQIEQQAQKILAYLATLDGEFGKFSSDFEVLGKHLTNANNKYDEASRKLSHFQDRLTAAKQPAGELGAETQRELPGK